MQYHVWDKCFTEIEALNTEGDSGKIIEWKLLLRPEICTKSKGLGEAVGCRVSIADLLLWPHVIPVHVQQAPPPGPAGGGMATEGSDTQLLSPRGWRAVSGADGGEAAAAICAPVPGPSLRPRDARNPPGSPADTNALITSAAGAARRAQPVI